MINKKSIFFLSLLLVVSQVWANPVLDMTQNYVADTSSTSQSHHDAPQVNYDQTVVIVGNRVSGSFSGTGLGQYLDAIDNLHVENLLESKQDDITDSWSNSFTHNQYTFTAEKPEIADGKTCRHYTASATIGDQQETFHGLACEGDDGEWQLVS